MITFTQDIQEVPNTFVGYNFEEFGLKTILFQNFADQFDNAFCFTLTCFFFLIFFLLFFIQDNNISKVNKHT